MCACSVTQSCPTHPMDYSHVSFSVSRILRPFPSYCHSPSRDLSDETEPVSLHAAKQEFLPLVPLGLLFLTNRGLCLPIRRGTYLGYVFLWRFPFLSWGFFFLCLFSQSFPFFVCLIYFLLLNLLYPNYRGGRVRWLYSIINSAGM